MRAVLSGLSALLGFGILLATQVFTAELVGRATALVDVALLLILAPLAAETALAFVGNRSELTKGLAEVYAHTLTHRDYLMGEITDAKAECDEQLARTEARLRDVLSAEDAKIWGQLHIAKSQCTDRTADLAKLYPTQERGFIERLEALAGLINERASKADVATLRLSDEQIAGELRKIQQALFSQATNQQAGSFGPTGAALTDLANRAGIRRQL